MNPRWYEIVLMYLLLPFILIGQWWSKLWRKRP